MYSQDINQKECWRCMQVTVNREEGTSCQTSSTLTLSYSSSFFFQISQLFDEYFNLYYISETSSILSIPYFSITVIIFNNEFEVSENGFDKKTFSLWCYQLTVGVKRFLKKY